MTKDDFWYLIDDSKAASSGNLEAQEQLLIEKLATYAPAEIVEFECILREYLLEADDYKIIAVEKVVDGYVSDDSYLYFRCWLIAQGREVFSLGLQEPDTLVDVIEEQYLDFEPLLYVATAAFEQNTGKQEEDNTFPRAVAYARGLDYDFGAITKGEDWTEDQLPAMLPNLWAKFNA